jgi:endonuclease/exonuclease/phosphatase (EEP) superfamily protein YafD
MPLIPEEALSLKRFGNSSYQAFEPGRDYGVMSWNILKSKRRKWAHDFNLLHPIYDILLLQEACVNLSQERIDHYDPAYSWIFGESFAQQQQAFGVLTGTRIQESHAFNRHGPVREPFLNTPKSTAFSYYPIAGSARQLLIINSHFINFRPLNAFEQQLKQIGGVIDRHTGPVLFAGDFNTWNRSRRDLLLQEMAGHGIEQVHFANEHRRILLLDYVFTRELSVREAHLLTDVRSSDHTPLSLWFQIRP